MRNKFYNADEAYEALLDEVIINGKTHTDPNRYEDYVVYNKVNEYYKYYYDKHNKQ